MNFISLLLLLFCVLLQDPIRCSKLEELTQMWDILDVRHSSSKASMSNPNVRLAIATSAHARQIFDIINEAYKVENGDSGVAFKKDGELRFNAVDEVLPFISSGDMTIAVVVSVVPGKASDQLEGRDIVISESESDVVVGCIYTPTIYCEAGLKRLYFGPFASKMRGVGKLLLAEAERIAHDRSCISLDINVINVRTDVLPWYLKNGYVVFGEKPYPKIDSCTRPVHFLMLRKEL